MGIEYFKCGCSIGESMFGDRPIMCISLCPWHAVDAAVAKSMKES